MPKTSKTPATTRFQKLVDDISRLYLKTREGQVKFAWETGRRIVEEEQNGEMRAAYGSELIPKLSTALTSKHGPGFSTRTLARMRSFYMSHRILSVATKLDWTDYVELMPVRDEKRRKRLEQRIIKEGLKSKEIRELVSKVREPEKDPVPAKKLPPLKRPTNLKLGTFALSTLHVKLKTDCVLVDCGFFISRPVSKEALKQINIVDEMSYTYTATIDRVVDADTLLVLIDAGFENIVHDRLRLRGINCPEKGTPEGDAAKKFVEKLLPPGATIVLKSYKDRTDQHGRFVVDVLYLKNSDDPEAIIKDGVFLNQELVDKGFAERVEY